MMSVSMEFVALINQGILSAPASITLLYLIFFPISLSLCFSFLCSPWISDYGQFRISALMVDSSHDDTDQYSAYNPKSSIYSPYYFKTDLLAYGTQNGYTSLEFTATSHGAVMEINFPPFDSSTDFDQTRRILVSLNGGGDSSSIGALDDGTLAIFGISTANSGGVPSGSDFGNRFVIGFYGGENGDKPLTMSSVIQSSSSSSFAWINFNQDDPLTQKITLRMATSFISTDQALTNLRAEVPPSVTFAQVKEGSKELWNTVLSRVSVDEIHESYTATEQSDLYTTFYSSLYRASLFPRQLSEYDENGNEIHWSPYSTTDTHVFDGPISTDSGFWDAYTTVCMSSLSHPPPLVLPLTLCLCLSVSSVCLSSLQTPSFLSSMSLCSVRLSKDGSMRTKKVNGYLNGQVPDTVALWLGQWVTSLLLMPSSKVSLASIRRSPMRRSTKMRSRCPNPIPAQVVNALQVI
jgi:hypothetical protein